MELSAYCLAWNLRNKIACCISRISDCERNWMDAFIASHLIFVDKSLNFNIGVKHDMHNKYIIVSKIWKSREYNSGYVMNDWKYIRNIFGSRWRIFYLGQRII